MIRMIADMILIREQKPLNKFKSKVNKYIWVYSRHSRFIFH